MLLQRNGGSRLALICLKIHSHSSFTYLHPLHSRSTSPDLMLHSCSSHFPGGQTPAAMVQGLGPYSTSAYPSWQMLRTPPTGGGYRAARPRNFATPLTFRTHLKKAMETCLYSPTLLFSLRPFPTLSSVPFRSTSTLPFQKLDLREELCVHTRVHAYQCTFHNANTNTGCWAIATTWSRSGAALTRKWDSGATMLIRKSCQGGSTQVAQARAKQTRRLRSCWSP